MSEIDRTKKSVTNWPTGSRSLLEQTGGWRAESRRTLPGGRTPHSNVGQHCWGQGKAGQKEFVAVTNCRTGGRVGWRLEALFWHQTYPPPICTLTKGLFSNWNNGANASKLLTLLKSLAQSEILMQQTNHRLTIHAIFCNYLTF